MSTLPLDTHSDDLNSLKPLNTTAPNGIPSFKTTSDVSEDGAHLWQSTTTETYVQSAKNAATETHVQTAQDAVPTVKKPHYAPWEQMSLAIRSEEQTRTAITAKTFVSTSPITYEDAIAPTKTRFLNALCQGDPYELLSSLLETAEYPELIGSLPDTTVLQILRLMDPKPLIDPYKLLHATLSPKVRSIANSELNQLLADYTSVYEHIIQKIFTDRQSLGFQKYEILLSLARTTGNRQLATLTWKNMLLNRHKPDVVCYNYYFEALCWHDAPRPHTRRVPPRSQGGPFGVKSIVQRMFGKMIQDGVMADAKTFGLLMTACSREGDLEGVKKILKKVWYVDVDAIMEASDDSGRHDDFQPDSALHPTSDLLYTIAHIFGSNDNVTVALRIVNHISRRFSLSIDNRTWNELATWVYCLARKPSSYLRASYDIVEQIPKWSIEALCYTIASSTMPTMQVLHLAIKMFVIRDMIDGTLRMMIVGLVLHRKSRSISLSSRTGDNPRALVKSSVSALQYTGELTRLEQDRDRYWIHQWVGLVLKGSRWYIGRDRIVAWQREKLPAFVTLFWRYGGAWVYRMSTGVVRLEEGPSDPLEYWDLDLSEYLAK